MKMLLLLLLALPAAAQNAPFLSLTADMKPRQVGDIITVIVMEDSRAGQTAETDSSRTSSVSGGAGLNTGSNSMSYALNVNGKTGSKGGGSTERSAYFMAKVGATVREVLPGGNLRVAGSQLVKVNREEQKIEVSGVVRPQDISQDNMVYSFFMADANIKYEGKGLLAKRQRRGLLNMLFGWIF